MSFLSDVFSGNFGNLGHDLNPANAFSDFGSSAMNVLSNPLADVGIAASLALPFLAPELLGGALAGGAADVATAGADTSLAAAGGVGGFDLATLGPGVTEAGTAIGSDVLPDAAALTTGVSPFSGAGTAFDMGAGGDLSPEAAAAAGAPVPGAAGSATAPVAYPGITGGAAPTDPAFGAFGTNAVPYAGVTGGVPPAGAAAPGSPGLLSTIGGALKTAAPIAGLAGTGLALYSGYEQNQQLKQLQQQEAERTASLDSIAAAAQKAAQPILTSGTSLQQYIQTGTLPQAFQTQLDQAVAAAKAQRIQAAASMGQSTDPLYNTALAQDLSAIDMQAQSQKANIEQTLQQAGASMVAQANQLLSTGAAATDVAAQLPIMVQNLDIKLAQLTSQSIASFAAAMNGGARIGGQGTGATININSTTGAVT